jgi:hypothetical protein
VLPSRRGLRHQGVDPCPVRFRRLPDLTRVLQGQLAAKIYSRVQARFTESLWSV